jgi:D-proline reductase (dithiol) PrdB
MLSSKLEAFQQSVRRRWDPNFTWVINDTVPWATPAKPLAQSTIALLTTCGLYRADVQLPFAAWLDLGDVSCREIHVDTPAGQLWIAHTHYNHEQLRADLNVALPISHFQRLAESGVIGRLYPWVYSFMGYLPEPRQLVVEVAPAVARRLRGDGVDVAFLTPC